MQPVVASSPLPFSGDGGFPLTLDTPIDAHALGISVTVHDQEDRSGRPIRIEATAFGPWQRIHRIRRAGFGFEDAGDPLHLTSVIAMP
jgi:hypothetical protein